MSADTNDDLRDLRVAEALEAAIARSHLAPYNSAHDLLPDDDPAVHALLEPMLELEYALVVEDLSLPQRFGDCRIIRRIGQGGMGTVYEGRQDDLDRPVAVKVMNVNDPVQRARFMQEARTIAQLDHPNIVPIYAIGSQDGAPYLVMRLIHGVSLDTWLDETAQLLPPTVRQRRAIAAILTAARALAHAHARGIWHRDIKPANLLHDDQGTVWVVDFGLAKQMAGPGITRTGIMTGTLQYMAPEQYSGRADARSDLYALGLTLLELAAGHQVFTCSDPVEAMRAVVDTGIPAPKRFDPALPVPLARFIAIATAADPERRFQTAERFIAGLECAAKGASPESFAPAHAPRSQRRRILGATLVATGAIAVLWGLYAFAVDPRRTSAPPATSVPAPVAVTPTVPTITPPPAPPQPTTPPSAANGNAARPHLWRPGDPFPEDWMPGDPMPLGWRPGDPRPGDPPPETGWRPGDPMPEGWDPMEHLHDPMPRRPAAPDNEPIR
jgi:serine/threonine protein kinase